MIISTTKYYRTEKENRPNYSSNDVDKMRLILTEIIDYDEVKQFSINGNSYVGYRNVNNDVSFEDAKENVWLYEASRYKDKTSTKFAKSIMMTLSDTGELS